MVEVMMMMSIIMRLSEWLKLLGWLWWWWALHNMIMIWCPPNLGHNNNSIITVMIVLMTMVMMRLLMLMMTMIMRTLSSNLGRDLLDRQLGSHLFFICPNSVLTILIFCCLSNDKLSVRPVVESWRPQWDWWRVTWRLKIYNGEKSNNCKCTVEKRHSGEKSSRWQGTWQALHINRFSLPPVLLHFPIACVTKIISPLPVQIIFPHCLCE